MSFSILLISSVFLGLLTIHNQAHGFTKRAKTIDYTEASNADGNAPPVEARSSNDMNLNNLARSASEGAGRLPGSGAYCYRAVKQIVADAFGKDKSCVRGILSDGSAKNAGRDLLRAGFVEDKSKCTTPGAIRVYKGFKAKGFRATAGDIHGHVEVVGDEGMYHSFYTNALPANEASARRVLTGCYVPGNMAKSALSKCPDSNVSYKTKRAASSKKKVKGTQ